MSVLQLVTLSSPDGAYGSPVRVAVNQASLLNRLSGGRSMSRRRFRNHAKAIALTGADADRDRDIARPDRYGGRRS